MNDMLYRPAGSTAEGPFSLVVTPESAGWGYSGLRILALTGAERFTTGESEALLLPLSGSARVTVDGQRFELAGRAQVFDSVTDFAYLPRDAEVTVEGEGSFAIPAARTGTKLPARYGPVDGVPVELRGAGNCSRQVNNYCLPHTFEADRLLVCEVLTPSGNWSSYPPHKHDEVSETESELEEIYYFEIAGNGMGYQRVYGTAQRPIDVLAEVRGGDVVLIPHGWHGPSMAVPGYDMYYLNVMAGPGTERAWEICDDPAHGWIRDTWADQKVDARLPFGDRS
ncbi:5-deoxy-glucuronate isomerase [Sciscionella marina]|uniref:5-deoxy-glucuronate isomerase n=1 Tax=Sciscionella marina TaxID=508770 RepID=UPI00037B7C02|nr:5-deoxy-glucuronate isomerase [Sciscionella marina]